MPVINQASTLRFGNHEKKNVTCPQRAQGLVGQREMQVNNDTVQGDSGCNNRVALCWGKCPAHSPQLRGITTKIRLGRCAFIYFPLVRSFNCFQRIAPFEFLSYFHSDERWRATEYIMWKWEASTLEKVQC